MIARRNFAFGASTPWKRIRCKRGRGTSAASREVPLQFEKNLQGHIDLECGELVGEQGFARRIIGLFA